MAAGGVGNGSIIQLHKVLNAMFNYVESKDMVRRNYAKGCTKELEIYNNKREVLTIEQQEDFLELVEHSQELSWYYNLFVFFFETGCRYGESIGLTWSDVDFHKRFIKIDHQLIYELDENDERRFQVTDPNTIKTDTKPELLPDISTHILRHTACTRMA